MDPATVKFTGQQQGWRRRHEVIAASELHQMH